MGGLGDLLCVNITVSGLCKSLPAYRQSLDGVVDKNASMTILQKLKLVLVYLALLVPSFLVAAGLWTFLAPERLYHCSDEAPLVTFIPPFAHRGAALSLQDFDH